MLKIKINNKEYLFEHKQGTALLNGNPVNADIVKTGVDKYHLILNHVSYNIELIGKNETGKLLKIAVNGKIHDVEIKDKYDELLQQLGMDKMISRKSNVIKAPMPGLVLRILVNEGDNIKKGDALLVLEAMKMENIIKADGDGVVKKIHAIAGQAVEKNALLIEME